MRGLSVGVLGVLLAAVGAASVASRADEGPADATLDCGAVCDGVTDDAPAINACLIERREVVIPAAAVCAVRPTHGGGYLAIHMPSGSWLRGAGQSSVVRVLPTLVNGAERSARGIGSNGPARGVKVSDLSIENRGPRMTSEQSHALFFLNTKDVRVRDVTVLTTQGGDGAYFGTDTEFVSVSGLHVIDAGRNGVTVEGGGAAPRRGFYVANVTKEYTVDSDPTQRGGRLVDVEVSGAGVEGLVVIGNAGPGGIEAGNVARSAFVANVADRFVAVNVSGFAVAANSFHGRSDRTMFSLQRGYSGVLSGNWFSRDPLAPPGVGVSAENPEAFGLAPADLLLIGNRWAPGAHDFRAKTGVLSVDNVVAAPGPDTVAQ